MSSPKPRHRRRRMPQWPFVVIFLALFTFPFWSNQGLRQEIGGALSELVHSEQFLAVAPWIAIIAAAIALPFAIVWIWSARRESQRSSAIAAAAAKLGAGYIPIVDDEFGLALSHFSLLERFGRAKDYISNLCHRREGDIELALFDYDYEYVLPNGQGGHRSKTQRYTVLHVRSEELRVPPFMVSRQGPLSGLAKFLPFFNAGLEFPKFPEFSRQYRVHSADEPAAMQLFTRQVIDFFEAETRPIVVEGAGNELLCYFPHESTRSGSASILLEPIAFLLTSVTDNRMDPRDVADRLVLGVKLSSIFADPAGKIIDATIVDFDEDDSDHRPPIRISREQ